MRITSNLKHTVIWKLHCFNPPLRFYFSESAKGSDSEDDFIRQKTKAKAASDSDSDSDGDTSNSKKRFASVVCDILIASVCFKEGFLFTLFTQQRRPQRMICLEKLTTSLQTAMQRSLQPQDSPWYLPFPRASR